MVEFKVRNGSPDIAPAILKISAKLVQFALFYDLSKLDPKISEIAIFKKSHLKNQDRYSPAVIVKKS